MGERKLVPVGDVAEALDVSDRTVWRLVELGVIRAYKLHRSVRFDLDEVFDDVKANPK